VKLTESLERLTLELIVLVLASLLFHYVSILPAAALVIALVGYREPALEITDPINGSLTLWNDLYTQEAKTALEEPIELLTEYATGSLEVFQTLFAGDLAEIVATFLVEPLRPLAFIADVYEWVIDEAGVFKLLRTDAETVSELVAAVQTGSFGTEAEFFALVESIEFVGALLSVLLSLVVVYFVFHR